MSQKDYLSQYGYFAVISMHKYNIPASIIIAQGMLESAYGNSPFSRVSNNHFGIKCGEQWNGNSITHHDDSPEECFRSYASVHASFDDHGKFLKSKVWYNSLFRLDRTDYKSWAHGLQQAGYATDPMYAEKLIDIIERYNLSQLDEMILI
ncbi:hypothetical protein EI427_20065 [Flammeovirga pectinis]|uniref:Mannosyl-glycoprotein endo-beta-N-acetylglucosamidase-like domain-containing protein n=1 Tax=Flammeovirga pectinis TaxID=2494373 RepID=A0A3Q9FRP4_9BACT|nr:glucosaminidase domain-containing protein [Flammeovirga pectinis]AZQ64424.1 hypothetical protein EI427_20065 [Flammeovirga pectinis]